MILPMAPQKTTSTKKKKPSSVRHTRAIQRDRSKRPTVAPSAPQVEAHLTELIHPATLAQVATFHALGLRDRILNLPVMAAFVLSLIWRQLGSVSEAVRVLNHEGLLWVSPLDVSQQAVSERLRKFPALLFEHILHEVLPQMQQRWQRRTRPLSPALRWAQDHFEAVLALDGSTLDALLRKVGLLRDGEGPVLAGRMAALLNVITHLPHQIWYEPDQHAHDQRFWERLLAALRPGTLLLLDLGFLNYLRFDQLTELGVSFVTRTTQTIAYQVERVLEATAERHDLLVWVGSWPESRCKHLMRLVEVKHQGKWYRYLTNVVDPQRLPAVYVAALYWQRWRIRRCVQHRQAVAGIGVLLGGVGGMG